jgi:hypothetical protein
MYTRSCAPPPCPLFGEGFVRDLSPRFPKLALLLHVRTDDCICVVQLYLVNAVWNFSVRTLWRIILCVSLWLHWELR